MGPQKSYAAVVVSPPVHSFPCCKECISRKERQRRRCRQGIDTDTLSMAWEDISEIIRKAFTRATRRGPIRPSPLKKGLEPLQTFHARKQTDETEDQDRLDVPEGVSVICRQIC